MARATAYAKNTRPLNPELFYPLEAFIRDSGCSKTRIENARRDGVRLETERVGRRQFVDGRAGIDFLRRLAAHEAGKRAARREADAYA